MIKRIITLEEKERKHKRNIRIMTFILAFIMLFSTASYAFMNFEDNGSSTTLSKVKYNGITFLKTTGQTWSFIYAGENYETLYNPQEINLSVKISLTKSISDFYNKPLYFGINSLNDVAGNGNYEISKNLQKIVLKDQLSCLSSSCSEDYPIKNCSQDNVIIFKQSLNNFSSIIENQNCITINYAEGDEVKVADSFIFRLLGIQ